MFCLVGPHKYILCSVLIALTFVKNTNFSFTGNVVKEFGEPLYSSLVTEKQSTITPVHFSAISCVICIFRPVVVTGTSTSHFTLSQILNKSTKISKNQNKPTQLPVTTTCRKMQYCWNANRYETESKFNRNPDTDTEVNSWPDSVQLD